MSNRLLPTQYGRDDIKKRREFSLNSPRIRFVLNEVGSRKRILDIGCFVGYYSNAMCKLGNNVIGIDVSPEVIAEANRRYPNVRFKCIDAMTLTEYFSKNSFDAVVASEVIEHVLDPEIFMENIHHVLAGGGN